MYLSNITIQLFQFSTPAAAYWPYSSLFTLPDTTDAYVYQTNAKFKQPTTAPSWPIAVVRLLLK